ncbi:hypothetical protein V565_063650 [Rhizoctonia solani 123E]|uniref:Uncharacterized protein n=1 Tax=Rhizoctonia solani 123E TaxID=1423351 RepID=A0A074RWP0_9AGAM|nr:hypothetical protein V565_063650 [Rhizoctonia solani 123E]
MSTDSELFLAGTNLAMARRVEQELAALESLKIPRYTVYHEPTIVWNAARNQLAYVQLGASKISSPAVAEEPARYDEPVEKSVVKVISGSHIFSRETQGNQVKAVRVVQLNLASKHHQARPLRSSAPAIAQAQAKNPLLDHIFTVPALNVPQGGFVMVGNVDLFGVPGLSAKFEKWQGPAPSGVVLPNQPISIERATLTNDTHLSILVPELKGTAFDTITFSNVSVYHQNYEFDKTKAVGWHFSADLVINESCGALREVLSTALGVSEPTLSVYLFLGADGGWHKPPSLHDFTLEGFFAGLAVKPVNSIVLSKIAVQLIGPDFGFSVFGQITLDIPGSVVPLALDYKIQENSGAVSLVASRNSWENPLGAHGLELSTVSFSTSFALSSPWNSLTFNVSANLNYEDVSTTFHGTYSPRGTFDLQAPIHNVTLETINTLFRLVSHDDLALPDVDISIGTASLTLSSGSRFSIAFDHVTIGDYTSLDPSLAITPNNATLRGNLTTNVVQFGEIELKDPFLQVTFEKKDSSKTTDVIIGGNVTFSTLNFPAAVYLYKSPDLSAQSLEWTVLAALTVGNDALALSKVVPEVEGTAFDLALTHTVFVAASRDDPSLGNMITSGFAFHQGVQVCAAVGEIDALNSLMRGPVLGLTISANWSAANGFDLQVYMPTPTRLSLGNGVTTTPFTLAIATKPEVQLILSAGLNVPVAHSSAPLVFTLSLDSGLTSAQATGQMSGWWVNPFGISPNVKVGPNMGLSISVLYATFVTTGLPSGLAIQGGLMIGQTQAQLALRIDEDPMKELLSGELESLSITDLVDFASDIIDAHIPKAPHDLFHFQKVQLYICPAGVDIGRTFYPQGFSFQSDATLFGKKAKDVKCVVVTDKVSIKGCVENLALGPLTVRGATDPSANFDCELGAVDQRLLIDGVISLFGQESPALIVVELLPTPKFEWFTPVKFTNLLSFQLRGTLVGSISFTDLSDAGFSLDTVFEQPILQYMHDQIMGQFDQARRAVKDGIEAARKDLGKAEAAWKEGVEKAQAALDEAKKTWDEKNERVTTESNKVIDAYNKEIERLQNDIVSAQKKYETVMTEAQTVVSAAEQDRAQALQHAQRNVDNAKRQFHDAVNGPQQDVDMAAREFEAAFGDVQAAIEQAGRYVERLQNQIDEVNASIHEYEAAPWYEFWKKAAIPGLYATLAVLQGSKAVADADLQAAKAKLTSADFIAKKAALDAATAALVLARETGQAAIDVANAALVVADQTSRATLDTVNATLEAVRAGPEWVTLQAAKEALRIYKDAHGEAFRAATQVLADLTQCAEYIAYQTAQVGLESTRATSIPIDFARAALEVARKVGDDALAIGQWVADHPLDAFEIRAVRLSGNLRDMVGANGSMANPFAAHIKGVVAGQPFTLDGKFDPNKTADLMTFIFKHLWDEVKKAV